MLLGACMRACLCVCRALFSPPLLLVAGSVTDSKTSIELIQGLNDFTSPGLRRLTFILG